MFLISISNLQIIAKSIQNKKKLEIFLYFEKIKKKRELWHNNIKTLLYILKYNTTTKKN